MQPSPTAPEPAFLPVHQQPRAQACQLPLSAESAHTIFQAGLTLHNANLPIWDRNIIEKRPPANEFISRLKSLSNAQKSDIWHAALVAEYGEGTPLHGRAPHRLLLGWMTHLAVMAERKGCSLGELAPRMAWPESTPRAERFVRLLLAAAGLDGGDQAQQQKRVAPLMDLAVPVFKKRSGQGGVRELRALAHKLSAMSDAKGDAAIERVRAAAPRMALPPSPLRSPRNLERPLLSAPRRISQTSLPEHDVSFETDGVGLSPELIRTPSEDSYVAPYNELVHQLRAQKAQSRRPSTLSRASSWANVSDVQSLLSEGQDSWQDVAPSDA